MITTKLVSSELLLGKAKREKDKRGDERERDKKNILCGFPSEGEGGQGDVGPAA